jgi:hypothetical protein
MNTRTHIKDGDEEEKKTNTTILSGTEPASVLARKMK